MTSALIYARVSDDPTGQGRSTDSQIDECRRWADREGWEVVDVIEDIDRSASRHATKVREGWADVVTAIESGGVDVLVTWEASRAQRDLMQYTKLRKLCERTETQWAYSNSVHDMTDSTDRFRTSMDAVIAESESDKISDRVSRGVRSAAMDGRPSGRNATDFPAGDFGVHINCTAWVSRVRGCSNHHDRFARRVKWLPGYW
jgi:site-specific DNA recombinase